MSLELTDINGLVDSFQRHIDYLRISVTDRCNLNCIYCSAGSIPHLRHDDILRYEEIRYIVYIAASMGISKVRLTGGEPLLRPELSKLIWMLSQIEGIDDVSLTTNGTLLNKYAVELKQAGLKRVNISLDTLKEDRFKRITGVDRLGDVLSGIRVAHLAGLSPVKINTVVLRGINDDEAIDLARMSISQGWHVRFIELMPFKATRLRNLETISAQKIRDRIGSLAKLEPCVVKVGNGPARYYRYSGAKGTVGFISPMTEPFCQSCNRLRITSDGQLRPCLLTDSEVNLKEPLRNGANVDELKHLIRQAVAIKPERYYLTEGVVPERRPMCQIGG